jgi:hypothetical protein
MAQVLKLTREQIPMMIKGIASPLWLDLPGSSQDSDLLLSFPRCRRPQGDTRHLRANHVKETFRNLDPLIVNVREHLTKIAHVEDRRQVCSC